MKRKQFRISEINKKTIEQLNSIIEDFDIPEIDLIEIHNGRNIVKEYSTKQKEIQEKLNIRKVIGSDAHTFLEIGRNYIIMEKPNQNTLLKNIENGEFITKKCLKIAHFITKFAKGIKLIRSGDINGLFGIIKKKCSRKK